jgi:glycosyltransferase involved in cell wall biosynthesis
MNNMGNHLPLISFVIPVYNGEDYIEAAIESVLQQDYKHLELIVLDDGSTDKTKKILQQYNTIYWETHPNMGQANTLNKGWAMAKGEILSYLSADDLLFPEAASTSIRYLRTHPDAVMTYCDFNLIDRDATTIRRVRTTDFNYKEMVAKIDCPPGPGVFFKKEAFELAGGWNSNYRQMPDYEYWLRLGKIGKFIHIPEVLASFRIHESSQTFAKGDFNKSEEPIIIIEAYYSKDDIQENIQSCKTEAMANAYLIAAQLHWRSGRYYASAKRIGKAIRINPSVLLKSRFYKIIVNAFFNRAGHRLLRLLRHAIKLSLSLIKNGLSGTEFKGP